MIGAREPVLALPPPREGERREIDVAPEDVFQPRRGPPFPPRWAERSFFAPILTVVAISAALLYGVLLLLGAVWSVVG